MRRVLTLVLVVVALAATAGIMPTVHAEAVCRSHTWQYDPGKTPEGFKAHASDGCNVVDWTGNTTDVSGGGTLTFTTIDPAIRPWEPGYSLPGPQGGNYCQYRAAHEANLYFGNLFKVPPGTEVTVSYRCY